MSDKMIEIVEELRDSLNMDFDIIQNAIFDDTIWELIEKKLGGISHQ